MRRHLVIIGFIGLFVLAAPAADAGGGCHSGGPASGTGTTVEFSMNCMTPRVLHAEGERAVVTFVNRDQVTHNVFGDRWGIDQLAAGESVTQSFGTGVHPYTCTLHPGMVGTVIVGDGVAASLAGATPVRSVRSAAPVADGSDNTWVLAAVLGLGAGVAGTLAVRRIRTR